MGRGLDRAGDIMRRNSCDVRHLTAMLSLKPCHESISAVSSVNYVLSNDPYSASGNDTSDIRSVFLLEASPKSILYVCLPYNLASFVPLHTHCCEVKNGADFTS